MLRLDGVLAAFPKLQSVELTAWIEQRWVRPDAGQDGGWIFREIDIARIRLIYELRVDLAVGEDALPLVLSLLDQLYETRRQLRTVVDVLGTQPAPVRAAIADALDGRSDRLA